MIYRRNVSPNFDQKDEQGFASFHDAAEVSGTLLVMKLAEELSLPEMNSSFTELALLSYVVKIRLGEKKSYQARCERERKALLSPTFLCHFLWDTFMGHFFGTLFWDTLGLS